jgi:hypothetical protein
MEGRAVIDKNYFIRTATICLFLLLAACQSQQDKMLKSFLEGRKFDNYVVVKKDGSCGSFVDPCVEAIIKYSGSFDTTGLEDVVNDEKEYLIERASKFYALYGSVSKSKAIRGEFQDGDTCSQNCRVVIVEAIGRGTYYVSVYKL